jgi:LysM repeat protein
LRRNLSALALALALALGAPRPARADVIHVMARGETLAGIAERYYGNVAMESVLVAANYLYLQATPAIPPGTHLVVPSVTYHRVQLNDTWEQLARRHLGDNRRGPYLARINGASFDLPPSAGTVIRLPYLLRYVVNSDEPMFEIARRFYGDRGQVLFITQYNFLATQRLQRGQAVVLPLADVVLREQPAGSVEAALVEVHNLQRRVERDLPAFRQYLARGLYAEAVALGARMLANVEVTRDQRLTIDRGLAEAYAALDRRDLAAEALRDAIATDPGLELDPDTTPPKILDAYALARGTAPTTVIAPAPPTARPDSAH